MNWYMMNFQDSNSYIMTLMIKFHDLIMTVLILIMFYILYIIFWFFLNKFVNKNILHNQFIEIFWTLIPMFILIFLAIPSLKILYLMENVVKPFFTLKIMGHQWYWSYEYSDYKNVEFDSFMLLNFEGKNLFRLLDVDNRVVLPINLKIRGLVSSFDVIHSWAMPSLSIKVDSIPGRINQFVINLNRLGLYFGQCSEICGINHSFMPIVLEGSLFNNFLSWLFINFK